MLLPFQSGDPKIEVFVLPRTKMFPRTSLCFMILLLYVMSVFILGQNTADFHNGKTRMISAWQSSA